ncbi:MAG: type II secretion system protein [Phycisphaerales bacterium]
MKKRAFTLMEILVTIAISAVLLGILIPALRLAKEQSKTIVCSSNLRQNYLMLASYENEFNGYWPKTDSPAHTNQFHNINSQSLNGPLYYLWKAGLASQPKTWYCPAGRDLFENNWHISKSGKLEPAEIMSASGYQYRMYFAYNWPDVKTSSVKRRQQSPSTGYIKPSQFRGLALWSDTFTYSQAGTIVNHKISKSVNVMFNDSSIKKRHDTKNISSLDLSWQQAGDCRIPLTTGAIDERHNVALLWRFLETGN